MPSSADTLPTRLSSNSVADTHFNRVFCIARRILSLPVLENVAVFAEEAMEICRSLQGKGYSYEDIKEIAHLVQVQAYLDAKPS